MTASRKNTKKFNALFTMVLTVSCTLVFVCCNTTDPTVFLNIKNLSISSNLPGGTEGVPNNDYLFTASHSSVTVPLRYDWNFDDTLTVSVRDSNKLHHVFPHDGLYAVSVKIFNADTQSELSRATLVVNIRSTTPLIEMVSIPPGSFDMGSTDGVDQSERPVRKVTVSRALKVARFEVMQKEWDEVMGTSPSWFRGDSLPVENISWYQAVEFCNRLSVRSGLTPCYTINGDTVSCFFSASGYRLPTEAEWEYFARAGTSTHFYSGNSVQPFAGCLSGDSIETLIDTVAWYCQNADDRTHRCGLKIPNAFGLFDVIGNVSEWTWDWYDSGYYKSGLNIDPLGPVTGVSRCVRGGDFRSGTIDIRVSSRRLSTKPRMVYFSTGFRIVQSQ